MLVGPDIARLRAAANDVKAELSRLRGRLRHRRLVPRRQSGRCKLGIKPAAQTLGLTLGGPRPRQVRQAFHGEEAQRIQRGRDDIRVMVRYPLAADRGSVGDLENMRIRTPDGGEVPFGNRSPTVQPGHGFASIKRVDRNRVGRRDRVGGRER